MPNQSIGLSNYDPETARIQRQQQLAQLLQEQSQQDIPINSSGGIQAPISPLSIIAKALQAYQGKRLSDKADQQYADLQTKRQRGLADMLSKQYQVPGKAAQGVTLPEIAPVQGDIPIQGGGSVPISWGGQAADPTQGAVANAQAARPTTPQEKMANSLSMMSSGNPMAAQMAPQLYQSALQKQQVSDLAGTGGPPPGVSPMAWKAALVAGDPGKLGTLAQEGTKLQDEQTKGPASVQEYKYAVANGFKGSITDYQKSKAQATHITVSGGRGAGFPGLSEADNALLAEGIAKGMIDPNGLNSRTAKIKADLYRQDQGTNFVNAAGHAAMVRNAAYQRTINVAEALPTVLENVRAAGKKLNYSDVAFVGKLQGWAKGQVNDPDFVDYMTQRNDALLSIANVMRGVGMSDKATSMEEEASRPTMSPRAVDAYINAQEKSLAPRLVQYRKNALGDINTAPQSAASTPAAATHPQDQAAISWARANPNDPRSKAILSANGVH